MDCLSPKQAGKLTASSRPCQLMPTSQISSVRISDQSCKKQSYFNYECSASENKWPFSTREPLCPPFTWMHTRGLSAALDWPRVLWREGLSDSGQHWHLDGACATRAGPQSVVGSGPTAYEGREDAPSGGMHQVNETTETFWGTLRYIRWSKYNEHEKYTIISKPF